MGRSADPVAVVEAAYDIDADHVTWLRRLAVLVRPVIDGGRGLVAYEYDAASIERSLAGAVLLDIAPERMRDMLELQRSVPELTRALHLRPEALMSASQVFERAGFRNMMDHPDVVRYFEALGARDHATLQSVEPGGRGVVFTSPQRTPRRFDEKTRYLWARVAAHIGAARRLRAALGAGALGAAVEAVLTPGGRVERAEGGAKRPGARAALRAAVLRRDRARVRKPRLDSAGAIELWHAMVSGQWSLIDRFERGGRRYIVALRNEHRLPDPRALTPHERVVAHMAALGKSNKLIAYEIGLAPSTVGTHLAAAMRKLGASSRGDLVALVRQLGGGSSED